MIFVKTLKLGVADLIVFMIFSCVFLQILEGMAAVPILFARTILRLMVV